MSLVFVTTLLVGCAPEEGEKNVLQYHREAGLAYSAQGASPTDFWFLPAPPARSTITTTEPLAMRDLLRVSASFIDQIWTAPRASWSLSNIDFTRACGSSERRFDSHGAIFVTTEAEGGRAGRRYRLGISVMLNSRSVGAQLDGYSPIARVAKTFSVDDIGMDPNVAIDKADAAGGEQFKRQYGNNCLVTASYSADYQGVGSGIPWDVTYGNGNSTLSIGIDTKTGQVRYQLRYPK